MSDKKEFKKLINQVDRINSVPEWLDTIEENLENDNYAAALLNLEKAEKQATGDVRKQIGIAKAHLIQTINNSLVKYIINNCYTNDLEGVREAKEALKSAEQE